MQCTVVDLPGLDPLWLGRKWDKVFKNGPSRMCGRQPLKYLKGYGLLKVDHKADHIPSNFLKAVFHKFSLVHA